MIKLENSKETFAVDATDKNIAVFGNGITVYDINDYSVVYKFSQIKNAVGCFLGDDIIFAKSGKNACYFISVSEKKVFWSNKNGMPAFAHLSATSWEMTTTPDKRKLICSAHPVEDIHRQCFIVFSPYERKVEYTEVAGQLLVKQLSAISNDEIMFLSDYRHITPPEYDSENLDIYEKNVLCKPFPDSVYSGLNSNLCGFSPNTVGLYRAKLNDLNKCQAVAHLQLPGNTNIFGIWNGKNSVLFNYIDEEHVVQTFSFNLNDGTGEVFKLPKWWFELPGYKKMKPWDKKVYHELLFNPKCLPSGTVTSCCHGAFSIINPTEGIITEAYVAEGLFCGLALKNICVLGTDNGAYVVNRDDRQEPGRVEID